MLVASIIVNKEIKGAIIVVKLYCLGCDKAKY